MRCLRFDGPAAAADAGPAAAGVAHSRSCRPNITPFPLAKDEVVFVGEAVAVVIADIALYGRGRGGAGRRRLRAAAGGVGLPARPSSRVRRCAHHAASSPTSLEEFRQAYGDVDARLRARAAPRPRQPQDSIAAAPIRSKAAPCSPTTMPTRTGSRSGTSTQECPRGARLPDAPARLDENQVRVVAPDVGGGFGAKFVMYPEEVVRRGRRPACCAGRSSGSRTGASIFCRPIQERDQYWDIEVAFDDDGRLLGMRGRMIHDQGAYTPQRHQSADQRLDRAARSLPAAGLDLRVDRGRDQQGRDHADARRRLSVRRIRHGARARLHRARTRPRSRRGRRRNLIPPELMPYKTRLGGSVRLADRLRQRRLSEDDVRRASMPSTMRGFRSASGARASRAASSASAWAWA